MIIELPYHSHCLCKKQSTKQIIFKIFSLHDDNTLGRGRLEVDVVDSGAGPADDLHVGGAVQHLPRHFGVRAHDQTVVFLEHAPNKIQFKPDGLFFHVWPARARAQVIV